MARNSTIACAANTWTELSNSDVTAIRLQNLGGFSVQIMVTNNASEPADAQGAIRLGPGDMLAANVGLADIFPGVTAGYRVWALAELSCAVSVSHA